MALTTKKTTGPSHWQCQKCGRTLVQANRPLFQSSGKCPKSTNGNHSWVKK